MSQLLMRVQRLEGRTRSRTLYFISDQPNDNDKRQPMDQYVLGPEFTPAEWEAHYAPEPPTIGG